MTSCCSDAAVFLLQKDVYIYPIGVYNESHRINDMKEKGRNMEENKCPACSQKSRHREGEEYNDLIKRLNRIEGQVRGIRKMIEEDRYCVDVMTQASAVEAAIKAFNTALLKQHITSCVVDDIKEGSDEAVAELCELLPKLMK